MTVHATSEPRHLGPDHGSPAGFEQRCARAGRQHGAPARVGHTLGARLTGLLDSGLLAEEYPLRPCLRALADTLLHDVVRTVARAPPDAERSSAAIAKETTSLDLALAHRFAKHHDDPVLRFPTYVGERSVADAPAVMDTPCACGRALAAYRRRGRVPTITDTVQVVRALRRCRQLPRRFGQVDREGTVRGPCRWHPARGGGGGGAASRDGEPGHRAARLPRRAGRPRAAPRRGLAPRRAGARGVHRRHNPRGDPSGVLLLPVRGAGPRHLGVPGALHPGPAAGTDETE
ncbi:hypothetical protein OG604_01045 [Streptomyces sp. NBC_01231]|nr:hypothetical protein OG604_01045 [Streptomyces sp. NBC_01231]